MLLNEATIASTSQMLDVRTKTWCTGLLRALGIPDHLLQQTVTEPGTVLGPLRGRGRTGWVAARHLGHCTATHDTASAVVGAPVGRGTAHKWCYLSSGTWSLLGAELSSACIADVAETAGFTNELGYDNTIRFLKNIVGLWLVQECRRAWQQQGHELSYEELTKQAAAALAFRTLIDPAQADLQSPGNMPAKIAALARASGEPVPAVPPNLCVVVWKVWRWHTSIHCSPCRTCSTANST